MQVGLLITGNEILSGKIQDTNGPFMGRHLRAAGLQVSALMACGDSENDLLACLTDLAKRCDVICMTGGLGPTSDDLTADVVSKFFEIPTEFMPQAWQNCVDYYTKIGRTNIPESNRKQAMLPKGCTLLPNPVGTAIGFAVSASKQKPLAVYCMPGVPHEMESMFLQHVLPQLIKPEQAPAFKTWQIFGLGESALQNVVQVTEQALQKNYPQSAISYQAHPGYITYGVTLFPTPTHSKKMLEHYLNKTFSAELEATLKSNILYCDEKRVSAFLTDLTSKKNIKLTTVQVNPYEEFSEKWLANIAKTNLILTQAHVIVVECGVTDPHQNHPPLPRGQFYFTMLFSKDVKINEAKLTEHGWKKMADEEHIYISKLTVNPNFSSDIIHERAEIYRMCSLVVGLML